jgi:hypothetical protein
MITVEALAAEDGDCLWIEWASATARTASSSTVGVRGPRWPIASNGSPPTNATSTS